MPEQCPDCRGELVNEPNNERWIITFSTTDTAAQGIDTSTFKIHATLDDQSTFTESLEDKSGVSSGGRTEWTWEIEWPGNPESGSITVDHASLGTLEQEVRIYDQGAAA